MGDTLYANFDASVVWKYTRFKVTDFSNLPPIDADKILVEADRSIKYSEILPLLTPEIYCQISERLIYLIMNKNATKLNALKTLCSNWGLGLKNAAAFGDDYNDIEMLKECGLGIAVGNAIKEVKEAADAVAQTNDNDGVAKYIENYLLI